MRLKVDMGLLLKGGPSRRVLIAAHIDLLKAELGQWGYNLRSWLLEVLLEGTIRGAIRGGYII